jgi:hypothetical protein
VIPYSELSCGNLHLGGVSTYDFILKLIHNQRVPITEGNFVEIGCFLGGGTVKLCEFMLERDSAFRVVVVDTFKPTEQSYVDHINSHFPGESQRRVFDRVTKDYANLLVIPHSSFALELPVVQIAAAFIDGGHATEVAINDFLLVWNKLRPRGLIVFHDYKDPRVSQAVNFIMDNLRESIVWTDYNKKHDLYSMQKGE